MLYQHVIAVMASVLLAACSSGFTHDETLDGPYRLVAVDTEEDMMLCRSLPSGDCVGDGLPGPTVFAADWSSRYIVVAVHPEANRGITEFYYVARSPDDERRFLPQAVKGLFDQVRYEKEKARLHLPSFTRVFEDLE